MTNRTSWVELKAQLTQTPAVAIRIERISSKKAAEMLGISLRTLRRWERAGLTPPRDDPRYYSRDYAKADIEAFAKARQEAKSLRRLKRRGLPTVTS